MAGTYEPGTHSPLFVGSVLFCIKKDLTKKPGHRK
nr:MAG TPA: hypothetical protein [Bacteriophage sp.]